MSARSCAAHAVREALKLSIICSLCATACRSCSDCRWPGCWPGGDSVGRSVVRALCTLVDGAAAGCRRRRIAVRARPPRAGRSVARSLVRHPLAVHVGRRRDRPDVRRDALLRRHGRGGICARQMPATTMRRAPSAPARWYSFRRVTLPAIRSALVAGAVLSWARAFGEFGATITFAGSFPGKTQTLPLSVYLALDTDPQQAIVIALLMVAVSFAVLVALRDRWLGGGEAAT